MKAFGCKTETRIGTVCVQCIEYTSYCLKTTCAREVLISVPGLDDDVKPLRCSAVLLYRTVAAVSRNGWCKGINISCNSSYTVFRNNGPVTLCTFT